MRCRWWLGCWGSQRSWFYMCPAPLTAAPTAPAEPPLCPHHSSSSQISESLIYLPHLLVSVRAGEEHPNTQGVPPACSSGTRALLWQGIPCLEVFCEALNCGFCPQPGVSCVGCRRKPSIRWTECGHVPADPAQALKLQGEPRARTMPIQLLVALG